MRTLNRVTLMGHLAADVDSRQTKNGIPVSNFPLATNYMARSEDGKKKEMVDFHRIVAWSKLGEICEKYLAKGTAVYLEGRLSNHSFEDKEGNRHYRTEVIADRIHILTWHKTKSGKEEVGIESIPGDEESEEQIVEGEEAVAAV